MAGKIAFSGIPNKGEENQKCSPTKGNKIRSGYLSVAQKRAEMLHHPCILGDPQHRGIKIRSGCLTPTLLGAQKRAEVRGSPNKGTKSKVAHKWAEVLRNPYVIRGPRKGVQKWPPPGSWKKSHSGGP